jgi:hypothetical protein
MTWRSGAFLVMGAGLMICTAGACRQPSPTYEYGETETTITTTPVPPRGRAAVTTSTLAPKSPAWKRGETQ